MAEFVDLTGDKLSVRERSGDIRLRVSAGVSSGVSRIEILDFDTATARAIAAALIKAADEAEAAQ